MRWNNLLQRVTTLRAQRAEVDLRGVQYDSRRVSAGEVFVAMRGESIDGNRFIDAALQRGAAGVITDSLEVFRSLCAKQPELGVAFAEHCRRALAQASAAVFGDPQKKLALSAVTGTNGKTTTAFLLEQLLRSAGRRSVLIGTVETHVGDEVRPSEHTTPESRDTLALFAEGVRTGCTEAVMEFSSHALEQERVWGLPVDVAIFTNLTQDHLDYHGSMDAYFEAKEKLFTGVGTAAPRVAVINADDKWGAKLLERVEPAAAMRYGLDPDAAHYHAEQITLRAGETTFRWITPEGSADVRTPLTGKVNVYNWLAASCAALARGLTKDQIIQASHTLRQAPGRFQVVGGSREAGFTVVVDYAHTDDALHNLIGLARGLVKCNGGRVITLFGCGGDRDRSKRAKMGQAAGEGSDLVIVTSDNPRSEDPQGIIEETLTGLRETGTPFEVEVDRRAAIDIAVRSSAPGDIVLLAGKGHERVQIFAEGIVPFDDVAEAELAMQRLVKGRSSTVAKNSEAHR